MAAQSSNLTLTHSVSGGATHDGSMIHTWSWSAGDTEVNVLVEESAEPIKSTVTAARVWPAAQRLCELMIIEPNLVKGKRILELGSGCGLVAAFAAKLGADVLATDRPEVLPRLRRTAALDREQSFEVATLDWTDSNTWPFADFSIILGSDVTYGAGSEVALLGVLANISGNRNPATATLLVHCVRSLEQAALLWHSILKLWPGTVWIYDGFEILLACHRGAEDALGGMITFGLAMTSPASTVLAASFAAFKSASAAEELQPPSLEAEEIFDGFVGPRLPPQESAPYVAPPKKLAESM